MKGSSTSLDHSFDEWKKKVEKLIKEHPLHIISWEATRRCNLQCQHCGSPSEASDYTKELSTDEIVGAFEQIASDIDMSTFRHINITGGEPFVRNDLLEVLKRINQFPFYRNIDIQTNGIYIANNPEILSELKDVGVTGLGISIDGFESTHDMFRGMEGAFSKAVKAAKLAVEHGYVVTVSLVAHSKNVNEVPAFYEYVKDEIKPRVFRIMTIDPIGRMDFDSDYMLSSENLRSVIHFLKNEYQQHCSTYSDPKTTMVELGCGGWLGKELEGTFRPMIFHCIAGINNLGILYDGKLASCSNISRDFIEGDLRVDNIKDVWDNRYQHYRNFEWKRIGECASCNEWNFCHGGPMHKRLSDGTMLSCLYKTYNEQIK